MHEKHGKDGLVILSVTMDEAMDEMDRAEYREKTKTFLARVKPPFATYDLAFDRSKPPATLAFDGGMPRVFVFNRDNQFVLKEQGPDKDEVEKAVAQALKKK
jgi:hypothetical protein